jgi:hypothetical protein
MTRMNSLSLPIHFQITGICHWPNHSVVTLRETDGDISCSHGKQRCMLHQFPLRLCHACPYLFHALRVGSCLFQTNNRREKNVDATKEMSVATATIHTPVAVYTK